MVRMDEEEREPEAADDGDETEERTAGSEDPGSEIQEASGSDQAERPSAIFVIGAPGSSGAALAAALCALPGAMALQSDGAPETDPVEVGDRLTAEDAEGLEPAITGDLPVVDGAPKRSLQIPFLDARYERAKFIFCWRPPQESMLQAHAAWSSGRMVTHPDLEGWESEHPWSLALIPEWKQLAEMNLGEVVAEQWARVTKYALEDLAKLAPYNWGVTSRAALRNDPAAELGRLCGFAGIDPAGLRVAAEALRNTLESEQEIKDVPEELSAAMPRTAQIARQAQGWLAQPKRAAGANADPASTQSPLRSVHTGSMPDIIGQLGSSLLISTYQAGKMIVARKDGIRLNTHFRNFDQPMGMAINGDRLAVGSRSTILEYRNMPAAAAKLEPKGTHDACYILRRLHVTGDVRIHDVAYLNGELVFVATAFSCIAGFDEDHSFVPIWHPPFIEKVAPGDRCHLNGMEIIDDEITWVTCLGTGDEPGSWRENKANGGILMHVPTEEIVLEGLSMPHSPTMHDGQLYILESGHGRLCRVDVEAGTRETVCELPGFTRGLAFAGPIAFVGLSQIRETATFGGLPLEEKLKEKLCGVWAVNIETGNIVGFLRFEEAVQEVYDVQLLPGIKKPEVAEPNSETTLRSYVIKGWQN